MFLLLGTLVLIIFYLTFDVAITLGDFVGFVFSGVSFYSLIFTL